MQKDSDAFTLTINGSIETAEYEDCSALAAKLMIVFKKDKDTCNWEIMNGNDQCTTQLSHRMRGVRVSESFAFNQPFFAALRGSSAHGWPQLCFSFMGPDMFGRNIPRGYAVGHVPMFPGSYTIELPIFRPKATSMMQAITSFVQGHHTEFKNPSHSLAHNFGRDRVRTKTHGFITVNLTVALGPG
ncbi:B9 domain [Carpediemonas membranifera]|uniref:B9 domain-containing protein 1 n=1 Tax=Carpediemonas membranifera TaxID=201153 RepID=A0A8J6BA32_9EUKA|nr:B9 domain [Carpediemonas membranifera]|eukprot:KAG9395882.1 B9 domain [Carpediemonas membranifera]